ncbi:MAG: DUF922 domain-containing protein [Ignavibacteria bacterium]|nr:DUF922 domain-containing protein [Ignavibacteria bacterium]
MKLIHTDLVKMKPLFFKIIFFCFIFFAKNISLSDGYTNIEIVWSESSKIMWNDFKKEPPKSAEADAQSWVGVNYSWKYENLKFTLDVYAFFLPEKSWVKDEKRNDTLLVHEQFHFTIAELYSRKLKKAISEAEVDCKNIDNVSAIIKKLADENEKELQDRQEDYDSDTEHGNDVEEQRNWQIILLKELQELSMDK